MDIYSFLKWWRFLITPYFSASLSLETSSILQDELIAILNSFITIPTWGLGNCNTGNLNCMEKSQHSQPNAVTSRTPGFAEECLSAPQTWGKRNSGKSSCLPCRHSSTFHPGVLLPEPFEQGGPPALLTQPVSSKLLEPLLGVSSLDQHRGQYQHRLSSLQGKRKVSYNSIGRKSCNKETSWIFDPQRR